MVSFNLQPPKYLQNENFPLRDSDVYLLQLYTNSGEQLPTNIVQYREELAVDSATLKKFETNVTHILRVYTDVRRHTSEYRETILPAIVQLSSSLYNYSSDAAVYYKALYEAIGKLEDVDESNGIELNSSKQYQAVSLLVKREVDAAEEAYRFAHRAIQLLQMFASDIGIDEGNAQRQDRNFDSQVVDNKEFKKQIENIRDLRRQIDAQETSYSQNLNNIADGSKWHWIPFLGWLASDYIMRKTASELARSMKANKDRLSAMEAELASSRNMKAHISLVATHLGKILHMIQSVIEIIKGMEDSFEQIAQDLKNVKLMTDIDVQETKDIVAKIEIGAVLKAWEGLARRADEYRNIAFVVSTEGASAIGPP